MPTRWFYHPQFCPQVLLRNVAGELLDLLFLCGRITARRGRYIPWQHGFKSAAYHTALHRLRRQGLVVAEEGRDMLPHLRLETPGRNLVSAALQPECFWRRPWSGRWHVLVYDIPESQHSYRRNLRLHLKRLRLGKL